jgi:hypothetical protein
MQPRPQACALGGASYTDRDGHAGAEVESVAMLGWSEFQPKETEP